MLVIGAGLMMIVENAANAARFIAMRQPEILVAPFFVSRIEIWPVFVAGGFHRGAEVARILKVPIALISLRWIEVAAAAEPAFRRHDMARVHMRGGAVRIAQMRDQRNAGSPKSRIVSRA